MVTMIAIAVLMTLVVGAIRFTGTNRESAINKLHSDKMTACAETARRYLLSRLRLYGVPVASLTLDPSGARFIRLPDDPSPAKRTLIAPAHFGEDALTTTTTTVATVASSAVASSSRQVRDSANIIGHELGGQYMRVVMKCQEPGSGDARESEIEFVFRYGL